MSCHFRMMVSLAAALLSASVAAAATPANGAGQDSAAPLYRLPPLPAPAGDGMTGDDAMASDAAPRKEDAPVGSGGNNAGGAASDTGNKASSDNGDNLDAEAAAKSAGSAAATGGGDNAGGAASDTGNKTSSDNGDNLDAEAAAKSAGSAAATGSGGDNAGGAVATGNGELPFDFPPPTVDVTRTPARSRPAFPWRR